MMLYAVSNILSVTSRRQVNLYMLSLSFYNSYFAQHSSEAIGFFAVLTSSIKKERGKKEMRPISMTILNSRTETGGAWNLKSDGVTLARLALIH